MEELVVIISALWVCHDINILDFSVLVNGPPGLDLMECFQSVKYGRNVSMSHWNHSSSTEVYGFKKVFCLLIYSLVLRTLKQSKNLSNISQYFAVAVASGGPKDLRAMLA